jgi:predicted RNase H-like HicB family nuclease
MASRRQVLLHKDEDGWWIAEVPSLPGCVSQGRTKAEAITNVKEAIQCHTEALEELGKPVPEDDYQQATLVVVG